MARIAAPAVRHLTPAQLGERLQVPEQVLAVWRMTGIGPPYIRGDSRGTKATIRYPLAELEAWEQSHLVVPAATAT